jgi:hypothetical protein
VKASSLEDLNAVGFGGLKQTLRIDRKFMTSFITWYGKKVNNMLTGDVITGCSTGLPGNSGDMPWRLKRWQPDLLEPQSQPKKGIIHEKNDVFSVCRYLSGFICPGLRPV